MTDKTPTDILISKNLRSIADELKEKLSSIAGENIKFSLVVFNNEQDARLNYISNCDRSDVLKVFKTLVEGWEKGMPDIPAHEYSS